MFIKKVFRQAIPEDALEKSIPADPKIFGSFLKQVLSENKILIDKQLDNKTNSGKGYSVKKGLEIADGKYIIFQDGDLEYDPNDFIKFFKLLPLPVINTAIFIFLVPINFSIQFNLFFTLNDFSN